MIEMGMDGRCALITGGSQGIGFAAAMNFMRAGASVAIVARRPDVLEQARQALAREGKGKAVSIVGDVSKADDCARIFATAEKELGRVDVLLNNAGTHSNGAVRGRDRRNLAAGLRPEAVLGHPSRARRFPGMKARKWGRIVNVLNSGAKWQRHGSAPTSVTRAAGMALTKVLSNEGAAHNVLVNAVLVGLIQTDQWVRGHAKENKGRTLEEYLAEMARARAARPHRHRGGVRQYGPVPGVGCRQLRHRHGHQCRRRDVPGGVGRCCPVLNSSKPHRQRRPLR